MQKYILTLLSLLLIIFSVAVSADKVIIIGHPIPLDKINDIYYYPEGEKITSNPPAYYYFTMDRYNRICYEASQPTFITINEGVATVDFGGVTKTLHCYNADPAYFDIQED